LNCPVFFFNIFYIAIKYYIELKIVSILAIKRGVFAKIPPGCLNLAAQAALKGNNTFDRLPTSSEPLNQKLRTGESQDRRSHDLFLWSAFLKIVKCPQEFRLTSKPSIGIAGIDLFDLQENFCQELI